MPYRALSQFTTDAVNNALGLILLGLGISIQAHEYIGGVLLAMGCAAVIAGQTGDTRKRWVIALSAFFLATVVAWFWPWIVRDWATQPPVQAAMAVSGLASRWIWPFIIRFLDQVLSRTETVADRVVDRVVPPSDDGDDQ